MRTARTLLASALCVALAQAALILIGPAGVGAGAVSSSSDAGLVHVVRPDSGAPYLADRYGRALLLRGVDVNALVDYPADYAEAVPVRSDDFAEMAALGFSFVRLAVSWSRIMPRPGELDRDYLAEVAAVAAEAEEHGLYVVADMHQDNYNRHLYPGEESDGAPDWATIIGNTPCTPYYGTTLCTLAAFAAFWTDRPVAGKPLQDWYLQALAALGHAVGNRPLVAGVELMNEPTPTVPSAFETDVLYPFYQRMIAGLRAAGARVPLWFGPSIVRNVTDDATAVAARFSDDPDLVYAPHIYTGVFTPSTPDLTLDQLRPSYANAAAEASVFGTPWVVDEFGSPASPAWDGWLTRQLTLQDEFAVGSAFWVWKQAPGFYNWHLVQVDGRLRTDTARAQLLAAPHVIAVPGRLLTATYTPTGLSATVDGPGGLVEAHSGTVVRRGAASALTAIPRRVLVDGAPVPTVCRPARFSTSDTSLASCRLLARIPAGRHVLSVA